MASKNLGQVEGLYIGSSAPTNRALIWYDTGTHVHKTYDTALGAWTVLEQQAITSITYSALVSRAGGVGLTQGQWFKITDRSNALALAITGTKVQYVNNNGVPVVDDLGTHVMYNITSENLIIDEATGAYDVATNKLVFAFSETTPAMNTGDTDVDYVYGVQKRGNVKTQRKFRLSSFLSSVTGNDISWNGGFFFNFYNKLRTYLNVSGGVVSHDTFEQYKNSNNSAIESINTNTQQSIQQVQQSIGNATSDDAIYSKHLPTAPTEGSPVDIAQGDTLSGLINKIQRFINRFKHADGIEMPVNYVPAQTASPVNNNDTVSSAIGKLSKYATKHETGDGIAVSNSTFVPLDSDTGSITNIDTLTTAIKKLLYNLTHIQTGFLLDGAVTGDKIGYRTVTEDKIDYGIFPSDICKVNVQFTGESAPTDVSGISIGLNLVAGNAGLFKSNVNGDPYDKFRSTNQIIAFSPVVSNFLGNDLDKRLISCASMPHYQGYKLEGGEYSGAVLQIMIAFDATSYASLSSNLNIAVLNFTNFTVYGQSLTIGSRTVDLNQVLIFTVNLDAALFRTSGQQIVRDITVEGTLELYFSRTD